MPSAYTLEPTREHLHGCFSCNHTPILTIESGDTIHYKTLDSRWGLEPFTELHAPRRMFEPLTDEDSGHAVVGPIAISGAQPGMTLEVHIGDIHIGDYGFTFAGGWSHPVNERLGLAEHGVLQTWALDAERMVGRNQHGHSVALRPFMGVMGMPPSAEGVHTTIPPRFTGGNIDCRDLTSGSILYLPIAVEGGYFYVGDGHAAQGDGEVSVTAIECPIEHVDLTFVVQPTPLAMPRAKTRDGWITFGFHEDLQEALYLALEGMLTLMGDLYGITDRADALALASVTVDMRVTQIVNQVRGVHAFLPHGAIR